MEKYNASVPKKMYKILKEFALIAMFVMALMIAEGQYQ